MNLTVKRLPLPILAGLCLLPAFQTAVSVHFQWHTAITYPALKTLMIIIPIAAWLMSRLSAKEALDLLGWKRTNMLPGVVVGVVMSGCVLACYYGWLRPGIDPALLAGKVRSLGLVEYYWVMAVFISLLHSLFEEYYWRGFILVQLRSRLRGTAALCLIGGVLFGLHHIFALLWLPGLALVGLCVVGTMAAGGIWFWMRLRGYSILDCYVSHVLADLTIFWIGYDLLQN